MIAQVKVSGWQRFKTLMRKITVEQWQAIDEEYLVKPGLDGRTAAVLVIAALMLILIEYAGSRQIFRAYAPPELKPTGFVLLAEYAWWAGGCVVGYLVIPGLVVKFAFRENLSNWGFRTRGFAQHLWIYAALFGLVFPFVVGASFTTAFQMNYPFYNLATRSLLDLFMWEMMYALQFLALEFFFRGFLLFGTARSLGSAAVFVMAVPYAMIHFNKPVAETCGAILAGITLGTVSLRTRSIYAGVLIHVAVAWSMDTLSLLQKGKLSALWG